MLAAGTPKPGAAAAYVAIDQFTGKLEDRSGGFVLIHRGTMTKAGEGRPPGYRCARQRHRGA